MENVPGISFISKPRIAQIHSSFPSLSRTFSQMDLACWVLNCLLSSIALWYGVKWVLIKRTGTPCLSFFPYILV